MILEALIANAAILLGVTLILWVVAVQIDDVSFIDSFWGFGMALMAFTSWMQLEAPGPLATLLMGMAVVWGLKLSIYLFLRWRREGEDKRYERMLRKDREKAASPSRRSPRSSSARQSCCSSSAARRNTASSRLLLLSRSAGSRWSGWRYTRHPNYFGDACVWWGIWIAAASAGWWVAAATVVGPLFLTFTLVKWSGAALLEKSMKHSRPGYEDYKKRTSVFIPMPPSKSG